MRKKDQRKIGYLLKEASQTSKKGTNLILVVIFIEGLLSASLILISQGFIDSIIMLETREPVFWISLFLLIKVVQLIGYFILEQARIINDNSAFRLSQEIMGIASSLPFYLLEEPSTKLKYQRANLAQERLKNYRELLFYELLMPGSKAFFMGLVLLFFNPLAAIVLFLGALFSWQKKSTSLDETTNIKTSFVNDKNSLAQALAKAEALLEIKFFSSQDFICQKEQELLEIEPRKKDQKVLISQGSILAIISYLIALALLGYFVLKGETPLGSFVVVLLWGSVFQRNLQQSLYSYFKIVEDETFQTDINSFLSFKRQIKKRLEASKPNESGLFVELLNVSFTYPDSNKVLRDLSLKVSQGEKVAILGAKGSGKSTLAKLILGLYNPDCGVIGYFDGSGKTLKSELARNKMTAVFEDHINYQLTLRENIAFGDIARINDELGLAKVLVNVSALDILERKDGNWDSQLKETDLTSEEWLKLALARALFSERDLIILDELSIYAKEDLIYLQKLLKLCEGKTVIMFSENKDIARFANSIYRLEKGCLSLAE